MEDHTMKFNYKNNYYELAELTEPNKNETFDIIAIFKIKYCVWEGLELKEVSKDVYDKTDDNFEKMEMVDYFYGSDDEDDVLISTAKEIIDRRSE